MEEEHTTIIVIVDVHNIFLFLILFFYCFFYKILQFFSLMTEYHNDVYIYIFIIFELSFSSSMSEFIFSFSFVDIV